jgi:hypothetical protein
MMRLLAIALTFFSLSLSSGVVHLLLRAERTSAPAEIIQIADWHWMPAGPCNDSDNRELVERIQKQQMAAIRELQVREVWIEGQSDETIADFRRHIRKLRQVQPPEGDSPVDQLIRDTYEEDLLDIGAAGRLLLEGAIDDVLPLEDHQAWLAASPTDCEIQAATNARREQAIVKRLPRRAVIVLGVGHDLSRRLPPGTRYEVVRVEALSGM